MSNPTHPSDPVQLVRRQRKWYIYLNGEYTGKWAYRKEKALRIADKVRLRHVRGSFKLP